MTLRFAALALATPVLAPFPQGERDTTDPTGALVHELHLAPGEELLEYHWDADGSVPFLRPDPLVRIEYGERGRRANTTLYLAGNSFSEAALTGVQTVSSIDLALGAGRYGSGLALKPSTYLHLALPRRTAPEGGWTLSFWMQPRAAAFGRAFLVLGSAVDLALLADGRVRATLAGGASLTSPGRATRDAWSFVQVSYDPLQTRQLRLVLGDTVAGLALAPGQPERVPDLLKLGDLGRGGTGFEGALDDFALETGPISTAQALERRRPQVGRGLHTLRMSTTLGQREAHLQGPAQRTTVLDTPEELAAGVLEGAAVVGDDLVWAPARWHRLETRGAPAPRTTHPLVPLGGGRTLTFGGETRDTHQWPMVNTDDTWIFDRTTGAWSFVPVSVAPAPRCHMPMAYSPDHDVVLLFGGWRNDQDPGFTYGDTWLFHVTERRWEQVFPTGSGPGARSDHGLLYLPDKHVFLLLAGVFGWTLDPVTLRWTALGRSSALDENGQPTSYSFGASTACVRDPRSGLVVLYGGSYGSPPTNFTDTTALYDPSTHTYRVLAPALAPPARVRGGFVYHEALERVVLYGGVRDQFSQRFDDLWSFDPAQRTWSHLEASNSPGRRGGYYGMGYDEASGRCLLALGRAAHDVWLADTWELELAPTRAGLARYLLERFPAAPGQRWFAEVDTPGDSRAAFLWRSGERPEALGGWKRAGSPLGAARYLEVGVLLRPGSSGEVPVVHAFGLR